MCGIAGVIEFDQTVSVEGLKRMAKVMSYRGPDEEGFHFDGPVGLAHRRLSIIDLSSGQQPMESPDGQVWVVFNGEIYNYPELKTELEQKGHTFRTRSDTEVLLAMYIQYGLNAFQRLNGMFACAFWDNRNKQLVLARDRFGKKPLFYYHDSHRLLFASETKSLLAYGTIERRVNPEAIHDYLSHSVIVDDHTAIQGVRRLPPAHYLVLKGGKASSRPYWKLRFQPGSMDCSEDEAAEEVENIMMRAVKRRLMSEVPLGAFLSGGLDSSTVVAIMACLSERPVKTFTIGFDETGYSEVEDARLVAKHLGTDHCELTVKPSAFEILPDLVWYLDEPFGDSSAVPTYYVCKAAREHVTVALSGDGGDEVFAGYARYMGLGPYQGMERVPAWIRHGVVRPLSNILPISFRGRNYLYALGHLSKGGIPAGLGIYPYIKSQLYSGDFKASIQGYDPLKSTEWILEATGHLDPVSRYQYLDTLQYLPSDILVKVDRMSMANSLEVRSPLLDYELVEYVAGLPISMKFREGVTKRILRKVCGKFLPTSVMSKPKQGFAIPKDQWFRGELSSAAKEILLDKKTLARGYFKKEMVKNLFSYHSSGQRDYSTWIWCLIILEMWHRTFIDNDTARV